MDNKTFYQVLSAIKRCFSRSVHHREVLLKAKYKRKKGPRGGAQYKCNKCRQAFGIRQVQVDHKDPVVPLKKAARDMSWNMIVSRVFCDPSNLQVLCKPCHKKKTAGEQKKRKTYRAKKKG